MNKPNNSQNPQQNSGDKKPHKNTIFESRRYSARNQNKPLVDNTKILGEIPDSFEGIFKVGKNNIGFVTHRDSGFVVMIEPHQNKEHAFHGDLVHVTIISKVESTGSVTTILRRSKSAYAGEVVQKADIYYFEPSDKKEPEMRILPVPEYIDQAVHKKVIVELGLWIEDLPTCTIKEIIGDIGKNDTEMKAIVMEKGFDESFPAIVEVEAEKLRSEGISDSELAKRRDMRSVTTFTIDPMDAKDFDDALSWERVDKTTLQIGVHIADVSHYVTPDSKIDEEAQFRTTSVYLVDRVIPMLPEALSNELCSIRQDEDKLAFSVIFTINEHTGEIINEWFGRTVINSDKRFSYEEAQEVIDTDNGLFSNELGSLMRLSKIYTENRAKNGALSMDGDEVRFILDEEGKPIKVLLKKRIDTMRMIEEWMLLANRAVAIKISGKDSAGIAVYRIHDRPAPDRVEDLKTFLKSLGYDVSIKDGIIPPTELQNILNQAETDTARDTIQSSIVRSLAKAIYSTTNIGHYGLAFDYYTHFTSPIRRYPDVMVHRLLQMVIDGQKLSPQDYPEYERMCKYSSDRERDAQVAEWESIKYKQVEYMTTRIGQEFVGIITGLGKFGTYIAEEESRSEGMIRLSDLGNDFFEYKDKEQVIKGKNTTAEFRVGQRVKIKVKDTNLERRTIDYILVP